MAVSSTAPAASNRKKTSESSHRSTKRSQSSILRKPNLQCRSGIASTAHSQHFLSRLSEPPARLGSKSSPAQLRKRQPIVRLIRAQPVRQDRRKCSGYPRNLRLPQSQRRDEFSILGARYARSKTIVLY